MSFEQTLRLSAVLLAWAWTLSSLEHLRARDRRERQLFQLRLGLCGLLVLSVVMSVATAVILSALVAVSLAILWRFDGPYNGGSDKMGLLVLFALWLAHVLPTQSGREMALAYLAAQLVLSYFVSGWIKIINPEWRSGRALCDVFRYSAYPVSKGLRGLAARPRLLWGLGWAVMGFEVLFPLALVSPALLPLALAGAASFHFSNACFFGLNRFFWAWICAYPSLLWLQARVFGG